MSGNVVGVNQAVAMPAQNIGFAIPVDTVKSDVAELASHPGSVRSGPIGFLGVELETLNADVRSELRYTGDGAAVVGVIGGSPADKAGLEPGDVIQSVNGKAVGSPDDVASMVKTLAPGRLSRSAFGIAGRGTSSRFT